VSAVSAYAELFERGANERPADLARVLRGIRVETARMQTLIDDLLLLARLDEGRPLAAEHVDLVAVLDDAVDAARAVGPDWLITFDPQAPVAVVGDAMALRQIIDNLLVNVRTHTPSGTPATVRLTVDRSRSPGDVVLEVADAGPGLDAEHVERVFERFYRADPSRSRVRGGSGLGLAVVAALVAAHDGRVEVVSEPGAGATFRVHLALAPDAVATPAESTEAPPVVPVTRSSAP
jgi:two-component system OmpR family sensor kinase